MFENLSERLERSLKILKGEGRITEVNVAETLKDVRKALLDADVNYKVAKTFTDTVKNKAIGQNVLTSLHPSQLMVKIVHDELTALMGGETAEINYEGHPAVILMSGLQGSGKTTFSSKLANYLKKNFWMMHREPFNEKLFSHDFVTLCADDLSALMPFYRYFLRVYGYGA